MSVTGERGYNKVTKAVALLDAPVISQADLINPVHWINDTSVSGKRQGSVVYVRLTGGEVTTAVSQGAEPSDAWAFFSPNSLVFVTHEELDAAVTTMNAAIALKADKTYVDDQLAIKANLVDIPTRKKSEVTYNSISLVIPTAESNLLTLLSTLTPTSGTLTPFFNMTSRKLNVFNDDTSVMFKVNLTGSWTAATENRSMSLNFAGTTGNRMTANRITNVVPDVIQFATYFSVDKDGNMATNGTAPMIQSFGSAFTATQILITAEQVTKETTLTPH